MEIENKVNEVLNTIRPFLINDGGDIEFVKYDYENKIVYIKMQGACAECFSLDYTINNLIKEALIDEIPEINDVVNVEN